MAFSISFVLLLCACRHSVPAAPVSSSIPVPGVVIEVLEPTSVPVSADFGGTLQAVSQASVAATTAGRIVHEEAEVGTPVHAGQLLCRLDHEEAAGQVTRAEQALQSAQNDEKLNQAIAEKYASLARSGDVPQITADERTVAARTRAATVASATLDLKLARKALGNESVTSPIDGVVSEKKRSLGETVGAGEEIAKVVKLQPLRLALDVPEADAEHLRRGLAVTASTSAGRMLHGVVSLLHPTIEPAMRSVVVDVLFPNRDETLRPGLHLSAHVTLLGMRAAYTVPRSAIHVDAATNTADIYTEKEGRVARVIVQTGSLFGEREQVAADTLQPGEHVVVHADRMLEDGMQVRVEKQ